MTETATMLQPGFSVADAAYPAFSLRDGEVVREFTDWRECSVRVRFTNAAGIRWQELDSAGPQDRGDAVFEILGSIWLADYLRYGARTLGDGLRHYRLCFQPQRGSMRNELPIPPSKVTGRRKDDDAG